jgi:molybdopterin-containing oxidoreductase family membrane subunit
MSTVERTVLDPVEASLRPFTPPSRAWRVTVSLLGVVVLAGVAAWVVQLMGGMGVAGYSDHAFWAVYIADVVTFIGVSYGGAVVSAILRLTGATWRAPLTRLAEGTAVVTVLVGAALIIPHIGRPQLLWELLSRPNLTAPVFWDFVAVMTYMTASIVFFALPLVPDMAILHTKYGQALGRRRARLYKAVAGGWVGAQRQRRVLAGALGLISILIIPLAVSVHSVLAWAFATTSRPWWHESIWAPQFVVAALYSGVALVILVVAGFRRGYHLESLIHPRHFVRLGFILATFAATYLYMTFADLLPGAYVADEPTAAVFAKLLVGDLAVYFWMFVVVGGVLPLLLVACPKTRNVRGMVVASILIVPMMWLKRILMIVAPASYDTMTHAFGAYHFTWVSISITLAALAAVPLGLMLLFRVVPVLSIDEIEEINEAEAEAAAVAAASHAAKSEPRVPSPVGAPGTATRVLGGVGALLLVGVLGAFGVAGASPASAATTHAAPVGPPAITVAGAEVGGLMELTAKVAGPDGRPLVHSPVAFGFTSEEFGAGRLVPLGSVSTDTDGVARLTLGSDADHLYKPTSNGPQEFVASYTASGAQPVTAKTTVKVTIGQSAYHPAPPKALAGLGNLLIVGLFAAVATIWLTLGTVVVRVLRVRGDVGIAPSVAPSGA